MASKKSVAARRARPAAKKGAKRAPTPKSAPSRRAIARSVAAKPSPRRLRVPLEASAIAVPTGAATAAAAVPDAAAQQWRYLQSRRVEDIAQAFVSLTSELWIVKDRMAVLEQVLERHGIPAPKAVEAFTPEGEFKATLDAERSAWARRMIAALFPKGLPKVD